MGMGGGLDLQMHNMPFIGSFFGNPQEQYKQEQFQRAGEAYGAYRPEAAQGRMNALSNQSTAYQSANNLLGRMSGGGGGFKPTQMNNGPLGGSALSVGQPRSLTSPGGQQGGGAQDPLSALLGGLPGGFNPFTGGQGGPQGPGGFNPFTGGGPPGLPRGMPGFSQGSQAFNPFTGVPGGL